MFHLEKDRDFVMRLQTLNLLGQRKSCPAHSFLLDHHNAGKKGVLLVSGKARTFLITLAGEERLISYPGAGSFLGENALFSIGTYNWNLFVEAVTDCEIVEMTQEDVIQNVSRYPEFITLLMESASTKQANLLTQLQCATHFSVTMTEQVVSLLYSLFRENRGRGESISITHEEISQMIGRSRVSVTNTLGKLQEQGLIEMRRGQISIMRPAELWRLIGEKT